MMLCTFLVHTLQWPLKEGRLGCTDFGFVVRVSALQQLQKHQLWGKDTPVDWYVTV